MTGPAAPWLLLLWSYPTMPFLFILPSARFEELAPWEEGAQRWCRLRVHLPNSMDTHCAVQESCY